MFNCKTKKQALKKIETIVKASTKNFKKKLNIETHLHILILIIIIKLHIENP